MYNIKYDLVHFVDNIFKCAFLHTVRWFQIFLSNTNNSIYYRSFVFHTVKMIPSIAMYLEKFN